MLSIAYPIVLWAYSYIKLLMSSTKAVVNSLDECTFFEKAAQLSDIVQDKLNDNNDETFSINTFCNCRSQYNKFVYLAEQFGINHWILHKNIREQNGLTRSIVHKNKKQQKGISH